MMRARGARATDIVVLVVAADDGVMPQTVEAIDHARAAGCRSSSPSTRSTRPTPTMTGSSRPSPTRAAARGVGRRHVVVRDLGAQQKIGIDELLEMILLQADLLELKAAVEGPPGVVLEARKRGGPRHVATVLVQHGTLKVGDVFVAGAAWGRVRAMLDDRGQRVRGGPATPVEVTGFDDIPNSGDSLQVVEDESKARRSPSSASRRSARRPSRKSSQASRSTRSSADRPRARSRSSRSSSRPTCRARSRSCTQTPSTSSRRPRSRSTCCTPASGDLGQRRPPRLGLRGDRHRLQREARAKAQSWPRRKASRSASTRSSTS
jgi:translation initiation factor IF-2